ncbi:hypothetical protein [Nonomuraea pusilla]|uniref:Uncharacterized protein n=1 Tax=Nonomuraea pusilla TaxID=46177 RepID=A0A1H7QNY8_9ACTN|nr:hypothetical protein [Nonomuraea pusilla]SEL49642.1 hypothetical protein SAMN05660976_02627 [Nonomuraea pusilla]
MSIALADQDKITLRTAAYGAVSLMAAARRVTGCGEVRIGDGRGHRGHQERPLSTG